MIYNEQRGLPDYIVKQNDKRLRSYLIKNNYLLDESEVEAILNLMRIFINTTMLTADTVKVNNKQYKFCEDDIISGIYDLHVLGNRIYFDTQIKIYRYDTEELPFNVCCKLDIKYFESCKDIDDGYQFNYEIVHIADETINKLKELGEY